MSRSFAMTALSASPVSASARSTGSRGALAPRRCSSAVLIRHGGGAPLVIGQQQRVSLAAKLGGRVAVQPRRRRSPVSARASVAEAEAATVLESWTHDCGEGEVRAHATSGNDSVWSEVEVHVTLPGNWKLHWAVDDWNLPDASAWPEGTNQMDDKAVQTALTDGKAVIRFTGDAVPRRIVFVLTDGQNWMSKGAGDFSVNLSPPSLDTTVKDIVEMEQACCLFQRYQKSLGLAGEMAMVGEEGLALLFTWLRFSANKQLRWYHPDVYNYQGKDMASTQKVLAETFKSIAQTGDSSMTRMFARMTLAGLPRGGGNGDDIRMTILHIMRDNGIKEGHRPGIEDTFIKQWHQKLHSNTTPEDICICEAYLHFLHTGNWDDFWGHLWDNHGMTREDLAAMKSGWRNGDGITGPACHLPQLIDPFKHMLWILKVTHSGADMDTSFTMAQGSIEDGLAWTISDMLQNRNEWWVPGKIVEVREALQSNWKAEGSSRDVMQFDISLESFFRTLIERSSAGEMQGDDLLGTIELVLRNAVITIDDDALSKSLKMIQSVQGAQDRWSPAWSLRCKAALEYSGHALGAFMDRMASLIEPHAKALGKGCNIDQSYVTNFAEEVIRGHPLSVLSNLLTKMELIVADAAGLGKWQVISAAKPPAAKVMAVELADIQGMSYDSPTIIVTDSLGGLEDIPAGVVAVLSLSVTDVLSHVAIRARNQKVLLASCRDREEFGALKAKDGGFAELGVSLDGAVTMQTADAAGEGGVSGHGGGSGQMTLTQPPPMSGWVEPESSFVGSQLVGGKSRGLGALRASTPPGILLPSSVALPYGSFEKAMESAPDDVSWRYHEAVGALDSAAAGNHLPSAELKTIRDIIMELPAPAGLAEELGAAAAAANITGAGEWSSGSGGGNWPKLWDSIKGVWGSKWNDRAWLSRRSNGIPDSSLYMAVLVQEVLPADYAFVLHTANPVTGDRNEVFGELVVGLGEVLVGNHPGSALTFTAAAGAGPVIKSYPSKVDSMSASQGCVIARSDSNGEDLEGFAGAGLHDSLMTEDATIEAVDYAALPIFNDPAAAEGIMSRLAEVGRAIEAARDGQPQDIEGVVRDDKIYVVQSRPQVLHH